MQIIKDLPVLDCVGLQYPCCDHSFNPGSRFLRSAKPILFDQLVSTCVPLATWIASIGSAYVSLHQTAVPIWAQWMFLAGLAMSMTVNFLVTGLIVFRIFKVYREVVKPTLKIETLGATTGGSKMRTVIFVLVESGMALFSIQLARVVITIVQTDAALNIYNIIANIHQMLNVITSHSRQFAKFALLRYLC